MAYKALYRTYRPQTFEDIAGQKHITTTLKNAIHENKIAHAYLFAGPRGTGKTTIAKILAKAINCTGDNPPCNQCENCQAITLGEHPDVIEIDAASNNGVDEVRDLIDKVKYAPINGKYKVYIIDEVHMMSPGAFNALLKTLEEPPAHIVFILATTEPHKILPTIISRCQRFDFKRVEENDIINRLQYVLQQEHMDYEEEALHVISKLADGGMRDALSILEQCLAFDNQLTVDNINKVYGLLSVEQKIHFIKLLLTKNIKGILESLDQMLSGSIDIRRLTNDLIDILKDIIIYKNTQDVNILFVLHQSDIESIVPYILVEEAFDMIDILVDASDHYSQSVNAKTYFELAMLKICNQIQDENKISLEKANVIQDKKTKESKTQIKDVVEDKNDSQNKKDEQLSNDISTESLEEEKQEAKDTLSSQLQEEKETEIAISPDHIEVSFDDILNILVQAKRVVLTDIQDKWSVISRYCYNLNTAKYATMLCDAKPVAASEDAIIITFEYQPEVNNVNYTNNYHLLKKFLKEVLGKDYDFIAIRADEWPNIRNQFIEMSRKKILPAPQKIILHHIQEYQEPKKVLTEAQQMAVDMFGDIVEFEE